MIATARAALLLAAAAPLVAILGPRVGLVAVAAILGAVVADAFVVRRPPAVERTVDTILSRGRPMPLRVVADHPVASRIDLRQPTDPDLLVEPDVASGTIDATVTALRRGLHEVAPITARTVGPLGLGAWIHRTSEPIQVAVYPDIVAARRIARSVATGLFRLEGRRPGALGTGTEFDSIRDYVADDDIRQVNWRATGRMGRPMSNQYRIDQDRDVICVIDTGRLMAAPLGDRTRLDAAVDAATAVAYTADVLGDRCGVVAFNTDVDRSLPSRRRGGDAVVRAIFDLEPTSDESDYEAAFHAVARHKRALVMVFTDLLEQSAAAPLIEATPVLAAKHAVVVVTATDEDLAGVVSTPPRAALDVYRSVIALDAINAQRLVAGTLQSIGAAVVEAPMESLAAASVAAYLDAKRLARV